MPSNPTTSGNQSQSNLKKITWEEVQKHTSDDDCWLVHLGKVYDVSKWGKTHPGGNMIYLAGGTDASILVNCYHPSGINDKLLEKYCVGEVIQEEKYESYYGDLTKDNFYDALKERVVKHFKDAKKTYKGESNIQMYLKTLFILTGYFISLYFMAVHGCYLGAIGFGTFSAMIGMCIMHDGSHGAYSNIKFFNWLTCWLMDFIGSSSYVWEIQHVAGHHIHTNNNNTKAKYIETDPDVLTSYPFVRMHPYSERLWYHKYQHIYTPILFSLFTFTKVLYTDFTNFYYCCILHLSMKPRLHQWSQWFRIFFMKAFTIAYTIGLPFYYQGFCKGFCLYFVFHCVVGTILACMFQVTHLSEGCTMLKEGDKEPYTTEIQKKALADLQKKHGITKPKTCDPRSWAALQVKTACNWSLDSWFWTQFSGGLNHQIEHHLFPGVCHIHYPEIQQIVEKTCAEYGVPYLAHKTLKSAFAGLLNYLKMLGNPPKN